MKNGNLNVKFAMQPECYTYGTLTVKLYHILFKCTESVHSDTTATILKALLLADYALGHVIGKKN